MVFTAEYYVVSFLRNIGEFSKFSVDQIRIHSKFVVVRSIFVLFQRFGVFDFVRSSEVILQVVEVGKK